MNFIGELAALATSCFFAMTALIFTSTGRMVGSQVTNRMRLTFALIYLFVLNVILFREPLPFSSVFQANAIRMLAAVIFIWLLTAFERKAGSTFTALRENPKALGLLALGALVGPVLGVSASLLAVQHAEIGVASTLYTKSHTFFC
jgi:hypothetical protein